MQATQMCRSKRAPEARKAQKPGALPSVGGVLLGWVHGAFGMMGRGIHGGELEGAAAGVADVVPGSGRHENALAGAKLAAVVELGLAAAHEDLRAACFHADQLVGVGVDLKPNVPAARDVHNRHLQVFARPNGGAVIAVGPGNACDVGAKRGGAGISDVGTVHPCAPFSGRCSTLCAGGRKKHAGDALHSGMWQKKRKGHKDGKEICRSAEL